MSHAQDIIVMGGGVVGLCAAIAMRRRGYEVTVLEALSFDSDPNDPLSRVYAINQASQVLLQDIGVWDNIDLTRIAPYDHMYVWDGTGRAAIDFDARMAARDRLGVMMEESILKHTLIQCARTEGVHLVANWKTLAVEEGDAFITVRSTDQQHCGQVMIVADGARSLTRTLLGVSLVTWPYHQQAIVAKVRTEMPHNRTAYQVFCTQGPLAFLPLSHPHESSIVWSTALSHADELMLLACETFEAQLGAAFEHKLGALTLLSSRRAFPLHMQHVKRYTGPRWVLMGDAAHTIHPLAGLGLNVGLADLAVWLRGMSSVGHVLISGRMMSSYQRQRKHALWQMILFLQVMHVMFTQSYLPITVLRGLGLTLCNRLSEVKRMLIEHATGS